MPRLGRARPHRPWIGRAVLPVTSLTAGVVSFVSSGPAAITMTATDATGGTVPYSYQWKRNANGGAYSNLSNGGGVTGATTLNLVDGSAVAGTLYGYELLYTDSAGPPSSVTSNAVTAQVYSGGTLTGGGGLVFSSGVFS